MNKKLRTQNQILRFVREFPLTPTGKINDLSLLYSFFIWADERGLECLILQIDSPIYFQDLTGIKTDSTFFPIINGQIVVFNIKNNKLGFSLAAYDSIPEENLLGTRLLGDFLHICPRNGNVFFETSKIKKCKGETEVEHNIRSRVIENYFMCYWERFIQPQETEWVKYSLVKGEVEEFCPILQKDVMLKRLYIQVTDLEPIPAVYDKKSFLQTIVSWIK